MAARRLRPQPERAQEGLRDARRGPPGPRDGPRAWLTRLRGAPGLLHVSGHLLSNLAIFWPTGRGRRIDTAPAQLVGGPWWWGGGDGGGARLAERGRAHAGRLGPRTRPSGLAAGRSAATCSGECVRAL